MPEQTLTETQFKDGKGRVWDCALTLGHIRRVDKSDFSDVTPEPFSLLNPDRTLFQTVLTDTNIMWAVLWAIVCPQSEIDYLTEYDKAEADFLDGITPEVLKPGRDALWKAVASFFPEHQNALLELMRQHTRAQMKIGEEILSMGSDLEEILDQEVMLGMETLKTKLRKELAKTREESAGGTSTIS